MNLQYWTFDKETLIVNPHPVTAQVVMGRPLIPTRALMTKPVASKTGYAVIAVLDNQGLPSGSELIEDHRQQTIYNTNDYTQSKAVAHLGPVPEGWTLQQPDKYCVWDTDEGSWKYSQELERPDKEATIRTQRDALVERVSREINRLEDKSEDASAWRTYREQLRNVPEQDGFPFDITWPEQPADYTGK